MHNEWYNILKLRKQREEGDCADLKTTSFAATIDMGWPMPIVLMTHDSPEVGTSALFCENGGLTMIFSDERRNRNMAEAEDSRRWTAIYSGSLEGRRGL